MSDAIDTLPRETPAGTSDRPRSGLVARFFRDSAIYGLSSVLARSISLLLLPFYTRVLSPGDYGIVDLVTVFASLVNLTVALEVSQGLARNLADASSDEEKASYASTALWFTVGAYTLFAAIALVQPAFFARLVFDSEQHTTLLRIAVVQIWANGLFYLVHGQLRWDLRAIQHTIVNLVFTIAAIGSTVVLVLWFGLGAAGVILGQTIGYVVGCGLALAYARHRFLAAFDWGRCRRMLRFSIPLVPSSIAVFVAAYIDRIAIKELMTLNDVGIYGVSYRLASPILLVLSGFQSSMTPLILTHYREAATPQAIARMFASFVGLALAAWCALSLFSREVLLLFTTPAYYSASALIPLLAPALMLPGMYIFAPGLAIARQTHILGAIGIANAVVNTALNFTLIPVIGIAGAAVANLLSASMAFGAFMRFSQQRYRVPHDWTAIAGAVALTAASVLLNAVWLDRYPVSPELGIAKGALLIATVAAAVTSLFGAVGMRTIAGFLRPGAAARS